MPHLVFAQTPYSIEAIGGLLHSDQEGIAINKITGECTRVIATYTGERDTKVPFGFVKYFPWSTEKVETPKGVCYYLSSAPQTCSQDLNLNGVTFDPPTFWAKEKVYRELPDEEIVICDGKVGQDHSYCLDHQSEKKIADVYDMCLYESNYFVISSKTSQYTYGYTADYVQNRKVVAAKEIGGIRDITVIENRKAKEGECPRLSHLEGDWYPIEDLGPVIVLNNKICQLKGGGEYTRKCCEDLGYKYVINPRLKFINYYTIFGAIIFILFFTVITIIIIRKRHSRTNT